MSEHTKKVLLVCGEWLLAMVLMGPLSCLFFLGLAANS